MQEFEFFTPEFKASKFCDRVKNELK